MKFQTCLAITLFLAAVPAWAETPAAVELADGTTVVPPVKLAAAASTPMVPPSVAAAIAAPTTCNDCNRAHVWFAADVLSWRYDRGPLKQPLVTSGDPTVNPLAGVIGQPGTRILFGGTDLDYGTTSGYRLTLGGWFGDGPLGAEVSAFFLDPRQTGFGAASNATGFPALYIPVFNVATGQEAQVIVADPVAGFAGSVAVASQSRLQGWDADGLLAVARGPVDFTLLGGFRYAELKESLAIVNNSTDLILRTQSSMIDQFEATTRFYGGQVGGRLECTAGSWFFEATYKLALGCSEERVDVSGVTRQSAPTPLPSGTFGGAVFTQPSNIGRHTGYDFAAIQELNLRAGCRVCGCLRAYVGYDLFYWSQVARPGLELDRAINPSQSPVFGTGSLVGSARPAALTSRTDLFAHGFTAGVELRY